MKYLVVIGTRPEGIKLAPVVRALRQDKRSTSVRVCVTGQHRTMVDQVLSFFKIEPDYDLNVMTKNQQLSSLAAKVLLGLQPVIEEYAPDCVLVQGDTTTALAAALAAAYTRTKVAHIEAGLRSGSKASPFPEEINRLLIGQLASYHFSPTQAAVENLYAEGIRENVHNVGNTVVDALQLTLEQLKKAEETRSATEYFTNINLGNKVIVVTAHRRESFGKPIENICNAILAISETFKDVSIAFAVHPNPNISSVVSKHLEGRERIHLLPPLSYPHLVWLLSKSYLILSDSGGLQEEAPTFKKPILVLRERTERMEGVNSGAALLVGTETQRIVAETSRLLTKPDEYHLMTNIRNPYGDGRSAEQIANILNA